MLINYMILCFLNKYPKYIYFFNLPFWFLGFKCKVLEIIPEDLEGNHCEMMALMCLCMLINVVVKNVGFNRLNQF